MRKIFGYNYKIDFACFVNKLRDSIGDDGRLISKSSFMVTNVVLRLPDSFTFVSFKGYYFTLKAHMFSNVKVEASL